MNFGRQNRQTTTKQISDVTLKKLGLNKDNFLNVAINLENLKKNPPNIVIAEVCKNFAFSQDYGELQSVRKKEKYVMGINIYQKLQYDNTNTKKLLKPAKTTFNKIYKRYEGQDLNNKTLLVWRTGGFGDLLFIQPNLIHLKEKYPSCKIIFSCGPQYHPMLNNWDCIDELIHLPFKLSYLLKADYHAIFEGVIERCKEAEMTNVYKLFTKWLNLNLPNEKLKPVLNPKSELVEETKSLLEDNGFDFDNDKIILCQTRASSIIRTMNPDVSYKILNKLIDEGFKIILTDSPNQKHNIDSFIKNKIDKKNRIFNFSGYSKSIDYTIALASFVNCCLSIDSSLIHISQAVKTPVLGIYGPFPGNIRMSTYDNADWIDCNVKCSPCYIHGHKPCTNSDFSGFSSCFKQLDENEVVEKINKLVKND